MTVIACGPEHVALGMCPECGGSLLAAKGVLYRDMHGARVCSEDCVIDVRERVLQERETYASKCDTCEEPKGHCCVRFEFRGVLYWWLHKYTPRGPQPHWEHPA